MRDIRVLGCNPSGPRATVAVSAYAQTGERMTGFVTPEEAGGWRWTVKIGHAVESGTAAQYLDAVEQLGTALASR